MMEHKEVQSSTIRTIGFDSETKTLEVAFSSGGVYQYAGVPEEVALSFLNADSKGRFFQADIRPCYTCRRLHIAECLVGAVARDCGAVGCKCWCHRVTKSSKSEAQNGEVANQSLAKDLKKSIKAVKAKKRIS